MSAEAQRERIKRNHERQERIDRIDRWVKMAKAYLTKAENALYPYRGEGGEIVEPLPTTYSYQQLLDQALDTSTAIVEALPDDFFEDSDASSFFGRDTVKYNLSDGVLERVRKLTAALDERRRVAQQWRRIAALENTTGRTPEEALAYRAKAEELREAL